jgi:hypothetical protein
MEKINGEIFNERGKQMKAQNRQRISPRKCEDCIWRTGWVCSFSNVEP